MKEFYNSNQKIGIELEIYCSGGESGCDDYVSDNNLSGLIVTDDGSLGGYGAEIKFDQGVRLCDSQDRIASMFQIATDTTNLGTYFTEGTDYNEGGFCGPSDVSVESEEGETGLHVHFGMPSEFRALDVLRLIKNMSDDIRNIRAKAWRINERWAGAPTKHMASIQNGIERALSSSDPDNIGQTSFGIFDEKYTGINIGNINCYHLNTIEFRFGHSALMSNRNAFDDYLETLTGHWDQAFTGEVEMEWGDMLFREITPTRMTRRKAIQVTNKTTGESLGKFRLQF